MEATHTAVLVCWLLPAVYVLNVARIPTATASPHSALVLVKLSIGYVIVLTVALSHRAVAVLPVDECNSRLIVRVVIVAVLVTSFDELLLSFLDS